MLPILLIETSFFYRALYILAILLGVFLGIVGLRNILGSFITVFLPQGEKELVDIIYRKRYLEKGPNIVVIGGGTGLAVILQGLKEYTSNLSAVVTVADDGGSSGRLRQQFDILPPGDRYRVRAVHREPWVLSGVDTQRVDRRRESIIPCSNICRPRGCVEATGPGVQAR